MINYVYTAKHTETGEVVKAEVQAENEQSAAKLLVSQKLFPIDIQNKENSRFGTKLKVGTGVRTKDRVVFTRQLSTLINAGLPLTGSLRTVRDQVSNKNLNSIVAAIVSSVEGGSSLSDSFAQHPKVFNQIYVSMIAAGEASGTLDKTLERIAYQQEKDAAIVSKIRSAMIYPIIVLGVIFAVLIFMLTAVLPQITNLYKDMGKDLPLITQILANMSYFLTHFWYIALPLIGLAGYGIYLILKTERGGDVLDTAKIKTPLLGKLFMKVYMARYARTLGTLLDSGIPMLQGLQIVRDGISNRHLAHSIERSMTQVRGGKALSATLENDPNFLMLVPQMIRIGEQSGAIGEMLGRVAKFYEDEVDEEVKNISTTIEPLLMVVLGVIVGIVIAAILLPIYSLVGQGVS